MRCGLGIVGLAWALAAPAGALVALDASFDAGPEGFVYDDDAFRGTNEPAYASGAWAAGAGFSGGGLQVDLGGIDGNDITDMSGGFDASFVLAAPEDLELTIRYRLIQTGDYESNEASQALVELDGALVGAGGADFVAEVKGDGNGGPAHETGWRVFRAPLGVLAAGPHTLTVGGYNEGKTTTSESTEIRIDDVTVATPAPAVPDPAAQDLVAALDRQAFEDNVATLAGFGTRYWSQPGNAQALDWIEAELQSYGYTVERHAYSFSGQTRENVYATKVGSTQPDRMYIVSAHMDSFNTQSGDQSFAPGADDDASGTSLVLEAARVFAPAWVETGTSVRFVLWNNEETGLNGSAAYVSDRRSQQGVESPPGSGQYPEPTWLGVIQHDMIMFDHGLPVQPQQIPAADVDVEYQASAAFVGDSIDLAIALFGSNAGNAATYPAEVSADMNNTDSKSFQNDCAAVSVRENRRVAEIGNGANPNWHKNSDVVSTYSSLDFDLGFDAARTTVGAIAVLAGATVTQCADGVDNDGDGLIDAALDPGCDDANDLSERSAALPCDNGSDDDGDGLIDVPADPGCLIPSWPLENPICQDGVDNDNDGAVDFDGGASALGAPIAPADLQCLGQGWRVTEGTVGGGRRCGMGFESALALFGLAALRRWRRARLSGALRAATVAVLLAAAAGAQPLAPPGDAAWRSVTFPSIEQHTSWTAVEVDGTRAWRAVSSCGASGLALAIEPPIPLPGPAGERVFLRWRWRVVRPLALESEERSKPGDDFAARVSALFAFQPEQASAWERARRRLFEVLYKSELPGRGLEYVWTRELPRGTRWVSPYGERSQLIAQRGPEASGWHEERVDLAADYQRQFGQPAPALAGIALMTDADNGCGQTEALYANFQLEREKSGDGS